MSQADAAAPRVLLVKLSSLGDVVHTMPVVHDILQAYPAAQVDWVVEPGFAPLVRRVAGVARVIDWPQRSWRRRGVAGWFDASLRAQRRAVRADLRATAYDFVIDLQGLTKSALVARAARLAPDGERVAMANRTEGSGYEAPTRWLADRAVRIVPHIHALDRARELAARALGYGVQGAPDFGLQHAAASMPDRTVVFVHGTSRDDKLWPQAHWIDLGRRFAAQGWQIRLPQGSDAEGERAEQLVQAIGDAHARVWPRSGLDVLCDRMAATHAVVGVDSGLSHLAVALGLPHVQIYNFPTAWRTGPQPQHGHAHQVSVGMKGAPPLQAVWDAWRAVAAAAGMPVADAAATAA